MVLVACDPVQEVGEKKLSDSSYIIFGHFYGMCQGENCVETFKLTPESLFEETTDQYAFDLESANFVLLPDSILEKVKSLRNNIPSQLLSTTEEIIGQPDAGDWGGLYFGIVTPEKTQLWKIDKMRSNLPEYLIPFADDIEAAIAEINQ